MVFSSDRQRKAVMARLSQGGSRSNVNPQIVSQGTVIQNRKAFSNVLDKSIEFNKSLATSQRIDPQRDFPSSRRLLNENKEIQKVKSKIQSGTKLNKTEIKVVLRESRGKLGSFSDLMGNPFKLIKNRKALNEADRLREKV